MGRKPGAHTNKTETSAFRMRKETLDAVRLAAYDSHRSVSNWIECAILWALESKAVASVPRPKSEKGR